MTPEEKKIEECLKKHYRQTRQDFPKEIITKSSIRYDFVSGWEAAKEYLQKGMYSEEDLGEIMKELIDFIEYKRQYFDEKGLETLDIKLKYFKEEVLQYSKK